jgi:hydroxyacylglutathione hydrolase
MLKTKKFIFGPFSENTYLLYHSINKEALILDPGNTDSGENEILTDFITRNELKLKYIVVTHSHIDHVLGVKFLQQKFKTLFLAPEQDMPLLENVREQAAMFGLTAELLPVPDEFLETAEVSLGDITGKFLFTPGHTPGEHCLYFESDKILFSGDVLFKESIGRTDLWGGNYNLLINSITGTLLELPGDVKVYPGHGDETTIEHEKNNNPFLNS